MKGKGKENSSPARAASIAKREKRTKGRSRLDLANRRADLTKKPRRVKLGLSGDQRQRGGGALRMSRGSKRRRAHVMKGERRKRGGQRLLKGVGNRVCPLKRACGEKLKERGEGEEDLPIGEGRWTKKKGEALAVKRTENRRRRTQRGEGDQPFEGDGRDQRGDKDAQNGHRLPWPTTGSGGERSKYAVT